MARKTKDSLLAEEENKKVTDLEKFMTAPRSERNVDDKKTAAADKKQAGRLAKTPNGLRPTLFSKKNIWRLALVLIFVVAVGTSGYFYWQYKKVTSANNEAAGYVSKISKYMLLPTDEVPTLATVADASKLSSQPFFAQAQKGDKVLFFTKAQKAILYRPSKNLIVEAASMAGAAPTASSPTAPTPPNTPSSSDAQAVPAPQNEPQAMAEPSQEGQNQSADAPTVQKTATVAVYNGTAQKGLAKTMAGKISDLEGISITATTNAKGIFEKTIVIDLSGERAEIAQKIAEALGGTVGTLPAGEAQPAADVLVIGGSDFKL